MAHDQQTYEWLQSVGKGVWLDAEEAVEAHRVENGEKTLREGEDALGLKVSKHEEECVVGRWKHLVRRNLLNHLGYRGCPRDLVRRKARASVYEQHERS